MAYIGNQPAPQNITSSEITDGTITNADINASAAIDISKLSTTVVPASGGTFTGNVSFGDNDKAIFGAGSDLQIYHNGSDSYVRDEGTGSLVLQGTAQVKIQSPVTGENYAIFNDNGAVTLNYNNNLKFATNDLGVAVTGNATFGDNGKAIFGAGSDLQIYHSGTNSFIADEGSGNLYIGTNGTSVNITKGAGGESMATFGVDGAVTLYHDNAVKFATTSQGVDVTDKINIESSSAFAVLEMGGPSGAFIDMKAPFSDDYDGRIQYDVGGDGAFIISTSVGNSSPIILRQQNNEKLRTTATGIDVTGEFIADSYNETYAAVTSTSNATTVNCENANSFSHTLTENTTFTFSNPPASGTSFTFSIEIIQDASASGFTVTWPTSVDWPAATAPTLTATASAKDVFVFTTRDGGTNWYGFTAGQALA